MGIKYKKFISYEMSCYPEKCRECPAFSQTSYTCYNERGMTAECELGYMDGHNMRDFYGDRKYGNCHIESDERVKIINL